MYQELTLIGVKIVEYVYTFELPDLLKFSTI